MWRCSWMLVLLVLCAPRDTTSGSDCSPAMPSLSSVSDRQKAEHSQRLHLEALFNRYGENGSISLAGLRRLLQNLGLDQIRTVTVHHHEKQGHHHHGNHHHGDNKTHHHHHHHHTDPQPDGDHTRSHNDHSNHTHDDRSHDDHSQNDHSDHSHDDHDHSDHSHDGHDHSDHSHDDHSDHSHDDHDHSDHSHDGHSHNGHSDHSHDDHSDHSHDDHSHNDHSDHSHDDHSRNDHNHHDDDNSNNNEAQDPKPLDRKSVGKKGEEEFEKNTVPESTTASEVRRVRREEPTTPLQTTGLGDRPPHEGEEEDPRVDHTQCLNASTLLSSHAMDPEVGLTLGDFGLLCPALLNQLDRGACVRHGEPTGKHPRHHHGNHNHSEHGEAATGESSNIVIGLEHHPREATLRHLKQMLEPPQLAPFDVTEQWLYSELLLTWVGGFLSISIISLLSLAGVILIPLMNKVFFKFLLSFLVALAVGTLSGDAFLHLIPHSQAGHHHHHSEGLHGNHSDHGDHAEDSLDGVWKGLTALGGVYFMFLIEHFLTLGKMYKDKKNKNKSQKKAEQQDQAYLEKQAALEENLLKNNEEVEAALPAGVAEEEQVMLTPTPAAQGLSPQGYSEQDCENKCHSHFHDTVGQPDREHHHHHDYHHILHHHHSQNHHPHSHTHSHGLSRLEGAGIASLAWMVVMGDGLHNFSDGLAIGAAFTEGLSSGLSTSVAVFCHELPHELGDFAVLLKAGMTVQQAILYNVLSAMMAYLGMATGIVIGHYAENVSMWIFALTAGLFMYVALVDMMPEMLHNDAGDHGFSHWGFFCLQNAGILLGFSIMLLIAVFEHRIRLNLGE